MKKFFLLILILCAVGIILWGNRVSLASSYLSKKLQAEVKLQALSVLSTKDLVLEGFQMKEKGKTSPFFSVDRIEIIASKSLFSFKNLSLIQMDKVKMDIRCEDLLCKKNQWTRIIQAQDRKEEKRSKEEFQIERIVINDFSVEIRGVGFVQGTKKVHLDAFELRDINSQKGFPADQIIAAFFRVSGVQEFLKGVLDQTNPLQNFFAPLESENHEKILKESLFKENQAI